MKSKKLIVLVMALILILLTASSVSAKSERIYFTATEECDVDTIQIAREIINGQGNYLARHWTQTCRGEASIPEYTGTLSIDINVNLTGNHDYIFFVGKGRFVSDEGGVWNMNCLFPWPRYAVQCTGTGEGMYEGMQIFLPAEQNAAGTGYIVDHNQ
jgi:hypothetical protein